MRWLSLLILLAMPALGRGSFPVHRIYVQPSFCPAPALLELELMPTSAHGPVPLLTGLVPGDCVEFDFAVRARVCCTTTPRRCGARNAPIATPVCKNVIRP